MSQEIEVLSQEMMDFHQFLLEQVKLVFQQPKTSMGAAPSLHARVRLIYMYEKSHSRGAGNNKINEN